MERNVLRYERKTEADMMQAMRFLGQRSIPVQRIQMLEPTLESLFMEVTGR